MAVPFYFTLCFPAGVQRTYLPKTGHESHFSSRNLTHLYVITVKCVFIVRLDSRGVEISAIVQRINTNQEPSVQ